MAQHAQDSSIIDAVELLKDKGFDALAEAVTVLMNTAMVAGRSEYLGARPYERTNCVAATPLIERRRADVMLSTDVSHLSPGLRRSEQDDDRALTEFGLSHWVSSIA